MSPVPVDPFADFLVGAVANPDQVDARFLELYKALDPARNGIDWTNVRTGGLQDLVTSLPASPRDGQECYFLADGANGIIWHLRYRAGSASAYKWERVGGEALFNSAGGNVFATALAYTGSAYGDIATSPGPTVTVPLAGEYMIGLGGAAGVDTGGLIAYMSYAIGGAVAADADAIQCGVSAATRVDYGWHNYWEQKKTVPANTVLTAKYKNSTAVGAAYWRARTLLARPVRVG